MPKGFTDREKAIIRKKLIEQGYKQFTAYGLRKTNVDDLSRAAGISKGAFYLFYESKEALFMDVAEEVEKEFRVGILAAIDQPGPSARARLLRVFKQAFDALKTIPLLTIFSHGDYDLLARRIPVEILQEHLGHDLVFLNQLVEHCQQAGIPIQVSPQALVGLLYPLVLARLREDDFGAGIFPGKLDPLLELIAAFCLGEVQLDQDPNPDLKPGENGGT